MKPVRGVRLCGRCGNIRVWTLMVEHPSQIAAARKLIEMSMARVPMCPKCKCRWSNAPNDTGLEVPPRARP